MTNSVKEGAHEAEGEHEGSGRLLKHVAAGHGGTEQDVQAVRNPYHLPVPVPPPD